MTLALPRPVPDLTVTVVDAPEVHGSPRRVRPLVAAALPAVLLGIWALWGGGWLFPFLSHNHDEGIYLLQAEALLDGDLTLEAPENPQSFQPWLTATRDGRYVFKYTPVHAAFIAAGTFVGSARLALAAIAAGSVLVVHLLARELGASGRVALLATWMFTLSPLVVIQSATFLPYLSNALVLGAFAAALLRGLRRQDRRWLVAAGALWAVASWARPFDGVVVGVPLVVYAGIVLRRSGALVRGAVAVAVGGAPVVLLALLFNRAVTGSLLQLPFNLLEPSDGIGFGLRRLVPQHGFVDFGWEEGLISVVDQLRWLTVFAFGGPLLLVGALWGVTHRRVDGRQLALAATLVVVPVGYAFFWGPYNMARLWPGIAYFGPFYWLPVLMPAVALAAVGLCRLERARPRAVHALLVVLLVVDVGGLVYAVGVNHTISRDLAPLGAPIRSTIDPSNPRVVFLPAPHGPWLLHPLPTLRNDGYDGADVYAVDRGSRNLSVLDQFPDREAYQLQASTKVFEAAGARPRGRLVAVEAAAADTFTVDVEVENPTDERSVTLQVLFRRQVQRLTLTTDAEPGTISRARFTLRGDGIADPDRQGWSSARADTPGGYPLTISVLFGDTSTRVEAQAVERRYWYRLLPGRPLELLLPGEAFRRARGTTTPWVPDESSPLDVTITPAPAQ